MKRMGGWLGAAKGPATSPTSKLLTALDEPQALRDAMNSASLILNDEVERAEVELSRGSSPFHKLGTATTLFVRAALGFEKDIMQQAATRLSEAEDAASEHHRRAVRDPTTAHQSKIYPPGAEYALCHAETQLMSAVIAVLNESLAESLKGFYKLRKAFITMQELLEAEKKYMEKHFASLPSTTNPSNIVDTVQGDGLGSHSAALADAGDDDDDSDLEFHDAEEDDAGATTPTHYQGSLGLPDIAKLDINHQPSSKHQVPNNAGPHGTSNPSQSAGIGDSVDFTSITSDPVDLFIHSGTALYSGLLQLLLSLIPPAFSRILSIFSFRGDRETGLRLLWKATAFKDNVNGGFAGLITLIFHNAAIAVCDIHLDVAYPQNKIRALLKDMRALYPDSVMWILEEGRMANAERDLDRALEVVKGSSTVSPLRQLEALRTFETCLTLLCLHRYEECATTFIKCVDLNNWSHGMYYYNAGCAYAELYRTHQTDDPRKAAQYKAKAQQLLMEQVPKHTGKKKFMARQLPLDAFIDRKIAKWTQRSKARKCDFVDAIGVSPIEEMAYFWSGYRRMPEKQLLISLDRLSWSEQHDPFWHEEQVDERATLGMLRATCLRNLGRVQEAKATLAENVFCYDLPSIKACAHADNWALPVAHYENAVCFWQEAGGQDGDRSILQSASNELAVVEKWESFDLDARIGLKLTTARETLRQLDMV